MHLANPKTWSKAVLPHFCRIPGWTLLTCTGSAGLSGDGSRTATHQLVRALQHWWPVWNKSTVVTVFIQELREEGSLGTYLERNLSLGSGQGQFTPVSAEVISGATKNAKFTHPKNRKRETRGGWVEGFWVSQRPVEQGNRNIPCWCGVGVRAEGHQYSANILHYYLEAQVRNRRGVLLCAYFNCCFFASRTGRTKSHKSYSGSL